MQSAVEALVARRLDPARALLRKAVDAGHVDAALMEVALTANGSGTPADWSAAMTLLEVAAERDKIARRHLQLLLAMDLDEAGSPRVAPRRERLSDAPDVVRFKGFLSLEECAHIAMTARDLLEPSYVVHPQTGHHVEHPIRTSHGAVIGPTREDLVIRAINQRIAAISDTDVDQGEALAILRYQPGQQFRMHHDAIAGASNQRIKTVLLYLNAGFVGGETYFPVPKLTIEPAPGDAILFVNADANTAPDPRATHAGLPVVSGVKWLATRWIRARRVDPWSTLVD